QSRRLFSSFHSDDADRPPRYQVRPGPERKGHRAQHLWRHARIYSQTDGEAFWTGSRQRRKISRDRDGGLTVRSDEAGTNRRHPGIAAFGFSREETRFHRYRARSGTFFIPGERPRRDDEEDQGDARRDQAHHQGRNQGEPLHSSESRRHGSGDDGVAEDQ